MSAGGMHESRDGLVDRLRDLRNRIVASQRFRRFAARFPLTRPIARQETRALFDVVGGFVYSQILSAFVSLGLVDYLGAGPRTVGEIARHAGLRPERVERLMRAAVALGLAEDRAGRRFALGRMGAALVGNDGVLAMIAHHAVLYRDLADPVALLRDDRETGLQRYWTYAGAECASADGSADYSRLMARSQAFIASEVLDAVDVSRHRRLLDVGGGSGAFLIAAAARAPDLALMLFDLPDVAAIARDALASAGLSSRASIHAGNVFSDPLPRGADLVTMNRVLHDHDDPGARAILAAARAAMEPGATLLVAEPMAGTRGAERAGDAYFGFYLLAMRQGRPRRLEELSAMIEAAGFRAPREVRTATPLVVRVVRATA